MRHDGIVDIDWVMATYVEGSKKDVTVCSTGGGGVTNCLANLPTDKPIFGGFRHSKGRFLTFFHAGPGVSILKRGKASMHKNGTLFDSMSLYYGVRIDAKFIRRISLSCAKN